MTKQPTNVHEFYHAHVYFDESTLSFATQLCHDAGHQFSLAVGRIHQRPVGPHTKWSCQISFEHHHFETFIPWLDSHRNGLSVLIHGVTGEHLKDHTEHASWLGEISPLDLSVFK